MGQTDPFPELTLKTMGYMLDSQFRAIDLCRSNRLEVPALILIYTTIDIVACIDRPLHHQSVKRGDFIRWVREYMLPDSGLSCSADDLYGARCGLVHAYSADSNLSKEGKVAPILYAWGTGEEKELERVIDLLHKESPGNPRPKVVHVSKLLAALRAGVERLIQHAGDNPNHLKLLLDRGTTLFSNMPRHVVTDFLKPEEYPNASCFKKLDETSPSL